MHLTTDNRCAIYEVRPAVCRVGTDHVGNARICNQWQTEDGMPERFRVCV